MELTGKNGLWVLLMSSLLIVIPMVIFPARLGMSLATGSFVYSAIEIGFYGIVLFLFRPRTTLLQLLQGAGLTFLYRIILGTVLGVLIALMYNVGFTVALTLGVSRYLPAILLQIAGAPFAIRPIYMAIIGGDVEKRKHYIKEYRTANAPRSEAVRPQKARHDFRPSPAADSPAPKSDISIGSDINGFERAVRYLGEHHAVMVAAVIDLEGLTVAAYRRGNFDPAIWAPLSLMFDSSHRQILDRTGESGQPTRFDLTFGTRRLTVARTNEFDLMVLANHEEDDLLGIRITQALDIIRKYRSERYGHLQPSGTEEKYVSNT
ncbi:membrane hypothetical protein [Candidatus Zixiibacteriota bacterium]|nr:membrane hypothetical protein [candidate division Zixibacteria bacterium]